MTVPARGDYIDGHFRRPSRPVAWLVRRDPGDTRVVVGRFPSAGEAAVEAAVAAARAAQPGWSRVSQAGRIAALRRLQRAIARRADDLATLLVREVGKPLWEARGEVVRMQGRIDATIEAGLPDVAEQLFTVPRGRVLYRPLGVIAVLGPFNFPANLIHGQVVPALLTGNTVVVKPSELTPATGQLYAELVDAIGLPPGVFNLIQGDRRVGRALAAADGVDGVLFTGSQRAGRAIERAAARHPGRLVALEMGGKNAAIVVADADLARASAQIVEAAFASAGQRCSATSRVLVDRRIADALTARLVAETRALPIGHGFDPGVFMGPLATASARRRHLQRLGEAVAGGVAEVVLAGGVHEAARPGHYLRPSLHRIRRRDRHDPYQATELFAPDLAIDVFDDLDEAIELANATDYGLCLAVFGKRRAAFDEVVRRGRAGVINWNRGTIGGAARHPFGGLGRSGNHRAGGIHTIRWCVFPVSVQEG